MWILTETIHFVFVVLVFLKPSVVSYNAVLGFFLVRQWPFVGFFLFVLLWVKKAMVNIYNINKFVVLRWQVIDWSMPSQTWFSFFFLIQVSSAGGKSGELGCFFRVLQSKSFILFHLFYVITGMVMNIPVLLQSVSILQYMWLLDVRED